MAKLCAKYFHRCEDRAIVLAQAPRSNVRVPAVDCHLLRVKLSGLRDGVNACSYS
jgi:hypothetical protein